MKTLLAGLLLAAGTASANPTFNFQYVPAPPQAQQGFQAAAARWSSLLHDNVTVNLMVGFSHALGFIGGVDILDGDSPPYNGPFNDNQFIYVSTLDLFRYSALSSAQGVIDWTADSRAKYFSLDGTTLGPQFSTGVNFGDGRQASHWKDNLFIGLMPPPPPAWAKPCTSPTTMCWRWMLSAGTLRRFPSPRAGPCWVRACC